MDNKTQVTDSGIDVSIFKLFAFVVLGLTHREKERERCVKKSFCVGRPPAREEDGQVSAPL